MNKEERLGELHAEWDGCTRCGLCRSRKNVVFGEGNPNAKLLIIGGAPGAEEDEEGKPYVGEAGKVLNTFLNASCIDRRRDVYITDTVACRPFTDTKDLASGRTFRENRPPSKDERLMCKERVLKMIYIIDPLLIIALGKTALQMLLGKTNVITKMRGNMYTLHLAGVHTEIRYPVLAMYDPASLARSYDYTTPEGVWLQTGKDFKMATEVLDYIDGKYYGTRRDRDAEYEEKQKNN